MNSRIKPDDEIETAKQHNSFKQMLLEAADELIGAKGHHLLLVVVARK